MPRGPKQGDLDVVLDSDWRNCMMSPKMAGSSMATFILSPCFCRKHAPAQMDQAM